jgi:PAS domain-containing protein
MLKLEESLRETQAELDEALQAHDQALAGQELADDALRQARAEFEQRFHEHAGAHAEALDKLRMAEAEVERHKADREEAQTRSENTVQSLRSDYERRLRQESSLREKAEQDLTNANAQWERRLAEKTDALARVEESLRLTRAELDHHSAQSQQEQRRIEEALRSETAELKRQLSEHQTARGQADEALRQTCASFERELEERTRSHVSAHDALRDEIARRRDAEDKIRAAHELLEGIVQNHADALFAFDREGRITLWNPAMEEITGLSSAEVVGQPFTDVLAVLGQQDGSQLVADTLIGKNASAAFGPLPGALAGRPGWQGELSPLWGPAHEIKGGTGTLRMLATPLPMDQETNAALMREDPAEDAHDPEGPSFRPPHQSGPLAQQEHHSRWLSFN